LGTTDGGATWGRQTTNPYTSNYLYSVHSILSTTGWLCGSFGNIFKTNMGGLPIELTSFTAKDVEDGVHLEWLTASEINNYGFSIEAKCDLRLINSILQSGSYSIQISAEKLDLSSGEYFYRLFSSESILTKKFLLLK